jgi:hypothetical protein
MTDVLATIERHVTELIGQPDGVDQVCAWARTLPAQFRPTVTAMIERTRLVEAERSLAEVEEDWALWLARCFPGAFRAGFADHHREFWRWVWSIEAGHAPESADAFIGVWPRGGGKSTSTESAVAALGARGRRRYCLYVCATQEQADDHVANIADKIVSPGIAARYPAHANRAVGKMGKVEAWRRTRIRTAGGFTVDALGLNTAARGLKIEDQRPDLIVLDDVDARHDTLRAVRKRIETITTTILPTGGPGLVVLGVQNLIHRESVFAQLCDGRATFLSRRIVSGPVPALRDFHFDHVEQGTGRPAKYVPVGTPTWAGQSLAAVQALIDMIGPAAFETECQHEVTVVPGALWDASWIGRHRFSVDQGIDLDRCVVAVDPSVADGTSTGTAECGIVALGLVHNCPCGNGAPLPHVVVCEDASHRDSPMGWAHRVAAAFERWEADRIVAEVNNGGALVKANLATVLGETMPYAEVRASRGKAVRADPVAGVYQSGRVHHYGVLPELESQLTSWLPGTESPDRLDALVWGVSYLLDLQAGRGGLNFEADVPDDGEYEEPHEAWVGETEDPFAA